MTRHYHRPVQFSPESFDWLETDADPFVRTQVAEQTAWALLERVRAQYAAQSNNLPSDIVERVLAHAAGSGVDDMAQVWSYAHKHSLPGAMWRLYLLRRAAQETAEELAFFYNSAAHSAAVEKIVAGAQEPVNVYAIRQLCDDILRGVFVGDFADALDRAWAYCALIATGAAMLAADRESVDPQHATALTKRSLRYRVFADDLRAVARLWREGKLD